MTSQTPDTGRARSCAECGTRGEPGQSFCDACGAVLGWSDTTDRPDTPPTRPETPARTTIGDARDDTPSRSDTGRTTGTAQPRTPADRTPGEAPDQADAGHAPTDAEPAWDAFARPGAGTGTARTGHDASPGLPGTGGATTRRTPDPSTVPGSLPTTEAHPGGGTVLPAPAATTTPDTHAEPTTDRRPPAPSTAGRPPATGSDPSPVTTDRARSLLVPVADPEPRTPAEPDVAPVLPGRPAAQRPQVRAPGPESGTEGGVPCPWCATPNRPDRHFCGRCAMPMAGRAEAPARLPWWRRTLNSRTTETPWAGDRPRLRRGFGRILNWVVGALVLALIVTLAFHVDDGVQATRDHFAKRAPVGPDSVKASRSYPDHGAQLAFDKLSNTWWGPGVTQSGEGEWLEARFDHPTRLLDVVITPGVSTKVDQLSKSALPHRIEAVITAADGSKSTRFINLDQGAGGQRRKFRVGEVTAVRFILRSAYGAHAKKQVAIAEIEFFGRSNSNS